MAKQVFAGGHLTLGGTDISDYIDTVELTAKREVLMATSSGDVGEARVYGLYDWECSVTLFMDTTVETLLWTVFTASTAKAFAYRASQDARSATNPDYVSASVVIGDLPIAGQNGQVWKTTISITGKDGIALIRTATA
ncbi:MAG: hypothetical protein A2378_03985 [Candidatus Pacebacteria bacterium RIFOXYB1_FULL_44_10]|nr:MAG: hypothetical protein A2378_03985 [Candidatus Pacebacteria bacterium RIFOXYB1_FULL_44_10]